MIAPTSPEKITVNVTTLMSIMPDPTVLATAVPKVNAATKLKKAAQTTARPGDSTRGSGMIDIKVVTFTVIFSGLVGAIIWDLITWYYGLPTSSSHALVGGYAGAAVAKAGFAAILSGGWAKTIIFIFLSPLIGLVARLGLM